MTPANNGGLAAKLVADPQQLRELTAFFAWAAWASAAARPGTSHSYTNNFPYDPLAGNVLTGGRRHLERAQPGVPAGGHGHRAARLRQVRLSRLAQPRRRGPPHAAVFVTTRTAARRAQIHGRRRAAVPGADPRRRRRRPLPRRSRQLLRLRSVAPSCRATCCAPGICSSPSSGSRPPMSAARCSSAGMLGRNEPAGQRLAIHLLFGAFAFVDRRQPARRMGRASCSGCGTAWFWFGNQGWEYLELGRALADPARDRPRRSGSSCCGARAPARRDPERRGLVSFFLIAARGDPGVLSAGAVLRRAHQLHHRRYLAVLDHPSVGRRLLRVLRHRHRRAHLLSSSAWSSATRRCA